MKNGENNNYTLQVQKPFNGLQNIQDEFIKINDKWCEKHYFADFTVSNNDEHTIVYYNESDTQVAFNVFYKGKNTQFKTPNRYDKFIMCDKLQTVVDTNTYEADHIYLTWNNTYNEYNASNIRVYINKTRLANYSSTLTSAQKVELFKTWLSNNPLHIVALLIEPELIPCNVSQVAILNQLDYDINLGSEISYIYSDDKVKPTIQCEYFKDNNLNTDYGNITGKSEYRVCNMNMDIPTGYIISGMFEYKRYVEFTFPTEAGNPIIITTLPDNSLILQYSLWCRRHNETYYIPSSHLTQNNTVYEETTLYKVQNNVYVGTNYNYLFGQPSYGIITYLVKP